MNKYYIYYNEESEEMLLRYWLAGSVTYKGVRYARVAEMPLLGSVSSVGLEQEPISTKGLNTVQECSAKND